MLAASRILAVSIVQSYDDDPLSEVLSRHRYLPYPIFLHPIRVLFLANPPFGAMHPGW